MCTHLHCTWFCNHLMAAAAAAAGAILILPRYKVVSFFIYYFIRLARSLQFRFFSHFSSFLFMVSSTWHRIVFGMCLSVFIWYSMQTYSYNADAIWFFHIVFLAHRRRFKPFYFTPWIVSFLSLFLLPQSKIEPLHYITICKHISFYFRCSRLKWNDQSKTIELFVFNIIRFFAPSSHTFVTRSFFLLNFKKFNGIAKQRAKCETNER